MNRKLLKVQIKGLASTAGHLRFEEQKALNYGQTFLWNSYVEEGEEQQEDRQTADAYYQSYHYLHNFRTHQHRRQTRHHLLAYGFLNGLSYHDMEDWKTINTLPNMQEVERIVMRYCGDEDPRNVQQRLAEWMDAAQSKV